LFGVDALEVDATTSTTSSTTSSSTGGGGAGANSGGMGGLAEIGGMGGAALPSYTELGYVVTDVSGQDLELSLPAPLEPGAALAAFVVGRTLGPTTVSIEGSVWAPAFDQPNQTDTARVAVHYARAEIGLPSGTKITGTVQNPGDRARALMVIQLHHAALLTSPSGAREGTALSLEGSAPVTAQTLLFALVATGNQEPTEFAAMVPDAPLHSFSTVFSSGAIFLFPVQPGPSFKVEISSSNSNSNSALGVAVFDAAAP
jgi:hypothetical protein